MSVLLLRRKVTPEGDILPEPAADIVLEIEKPLPLRTFHPTPGPEVEDHAEEDHGHDHHDDDHHHHRPFVTKLKVATALIGLLGLAAAYPAMIVSESRLGDRIDSASFDRAKWTVPWTGATAALLDKQVNHVGWASDAADWMPAARLSAKPVFQSELAASIGQYLAFAATAKQGDVSDVDLAAAARLVHEGARASELRAAYESLASYDRRLRRLSAAAQWSKDDVPRQFELFQRWAATSEKELTEVSRQSTGSPIDQATTRAVYAAKARALAAYTFLDALDYPEGPEALEARHAAVAAWKTAAEFHPLFVFNNSPADWLLGDHAASMSSLITAAAAKTVALDQALKSELAQREAEAAALSAKSSGAGASAAAAAAD